MISLKEAIKNGKLPDFGSENESKYRDFFNELSISNNFSFDYRLDDEELNRLRYNSDININFVNQSIKKAYDKVSNKYNELINRYKKLSNDMPESEDKDNINLLISDLENKLIDFENNNKDIFLEKKNLGYDEKIINVLEETKLDYYDFRSNTVSNELNEKYEELKNLEEKKYKTKFSIKQNEKRIERVKKSIQRLQKKQGKLQNKQQRIINKGSEKYIKIKSNELEKTIVKLDREENKYNLNNDIALTEAIISELDKEDSLGSKFKKVGYELEKEKLNFNKKMLEKKDDILNRLKRVAKQGTVIFSSQLYKRNPKLVSHSM